MSNKPWYEWRSIKDELPSEDGPVLVHAESADPDKPLITTAWFDPNFPGNWSLIIAAFIPSITHWMPKPPPPSKEVH